MGDDPRVACDVGAEAAVRKAAELNQLPVDSVTEVPVELESGVAEGASAKVQRK